jgi:hypothetical protein
MTTRIALLAAGGTGGHLFPAEALAHELIARGWVVELATDERAGRYAGKFPVRETHQIASATPSSKNPVELIRAGLSYLAWRSRGPRCPCEDQAADRRRLRRLPYLAAGLCRHPQENTHASA